MILAMWQWAFWKTLVRGLAHFRCELPRHMHIHGHYCRMCTCPHHVLLSCLCWRSHGAMSFIRLKLGPALCKRAQPKACQGRNKGVGIAFGLNCWSLEHLRTICPLNHCKNTIDTNTCFLTFSSSLVPKLDPTTLLASYCSKMSTHCQTPNIPTTLGGGLGFQWVCVVLNPCLECSLTSIYISITKMLSNLLRSIHPSRSN